MKLAALFFIFASLIFGCAKPNYQNPPAVVEPQNTDNPDGETPEEPSPTPVPPKPPVKCKHVFEATQTCLNYKWTKSATATEMGSIELFFAEINKPLTPIELNYDAAIVLWMPSMGHGSRPVSIEKLSNSKYSATKIFFIMPGEWEIRFQLKSNKEVVDEYIVKIVI